MMANAKAKHALGKHALLIAASLVMLYPLLWMLASAFKPEHLIFSDLSIWPSEWKWTNFLQGWNGLAASFTTFYLNSFLVSGLAVAGNLIACSLAAFAFARLEFPLKRLWFVL